MGQRFCSSTGPVSTPSSGQNTVSPVSISPKMMGQFMAAEPRCRGSRLGWYWMVPRVGAASASAGRISVTKAITPSSAPAACQAASPSASLSATVSSGVSPASAAAVQRGSGRAPSRGAGAETAATSAPSSRSRRNTASPKAACPMIETRMAFPPTRNRSPASLPARARER